MRDFFDFDTVPCDEPCAQVGDDDYRLNARTEAKRFIAMLERRFPNKPEKAYFSIKSNPHDFGTYYSVALYFDDNDEASMGYAYHVEANLPATWEETDVIPFHLDKMKEEV